MKTIVLKQPGEFLVTDTDIPTELPDGFARVRVRSVGFCGTDWHAYHGRQPFFSYPRILGHELGVEVIEAKCPPTVLQPGDRCAVEPYLNCGQCIACRNGRGNCCVDLKVLGVHVDGGMREQLILPVAKLHKSDKLTLEQLALVETLAIGCHAVSRAQIVRGERALVLGAGPIGLSILPFLQNAGAEVVMADVSQTRREFVSSKMKVRTIDANQSIPEQLVNDLPTVILDATGNPQSMNRCFELVAHAGRIVFVGLFQGDVKFNDPNFHRRETTLLASRNALPADFSRIIRLIEDGQIDTAPWITHRTRPDTLLNDLTGWLSPESGLLKAMLEF